MGNKMRFRSVVLRTSLALLCAAPLAVLFGLSHFVARGDFNDFIDAWSAASVLYALAFWLTFFLLRRRSVPSPAKGLWIWALACGVLTASFVPIGTALALPCLFTLFWRRKVFFQRYEPIS